MSVEQVARDFVGMMLDPEKAKGLLASDAMASGGMSGQPVPALEGLKLMAGMRTAMPDIKIDVKEITVSGNQATVKVIWGGTHTGPLEMPMPGMPPVPPTGRKVSVNDSYVVTVQGEKVSHLSVESPADGGGRAMMAQLGVRMPGM